MEENFVNTVLSLHRENLWKEILLLNEDSKNNLGLKLLWVWPSIENLDFIKRKVKEFNLDGVISLGCGCGLFEWILNQYADFPVLGYEVNREWWTSKYSNPLFIPHVYPELPITPSTLNSKFALMFCYFNDRLAFQEYVSNYEGNLIFIIGPGDGKGTHTDPEPFTPVFSNNSWSLNSYQEIKESKDFVAVYVRDNFI